MLKSNYVKIENISSKFLKQFIDIFYILSKSICKKDQGSNDPVFKSDIMENNFF